MAKLEVYIEKNIEAMYKMNKEYYLSKVIDRDTKRLIEKAKTMTGLDEDVIIIKHFHKYMLDEAEKLLMLRRLSMRRKAVAMVKEMIHKKHDFEDKSTKINRLIENEFKYFGEKQKAYKEIAAIYYEVKKNEAKIK